jgi:TIR domain
LKTVFLAHARADHDTARQLAEFLEFGCNLTCYVDDGLIGGEQDLISKAEEGLSADVLVLLLSPASSPARWVRERWEPVLFDAARRGSVEVVTVLLHECSFPPLLLRRNFIDGTTNPLTARRLLKRWFWQREREPATLPITEFSSGLENLYATLADRGGTALASGDDASRFAREAEQDFEAVLWVPCQGRTLAQAAGELGHQLGIALDGTAEDNCGRIRDVLGARRCLVVLDAPGPGDFGRTDSRRTHVDGSHAGRGDDFGDRADLGLRPRSDRRPAIRRGIRASVQAAGRGSGAGRVCTRADLDLRTLGPCGRGECTAVQLRFARRRATDALLKPAGREPQKPVCLEVSRWRGGGADWRPFLPFGTAMRIARKTYPRRRPARVTFRPPATFM